MRTLRKTRVAAALGISKQLLNHYAKGALREAVAEDGDIILDHPAAVAFFEPYGHTPDSLIERDAGAPAPANGRPVRPPTTKLVLPTSASFEPPSPRDFANPPDVEELYALTFGEIVRRYSSLEGFEGWVDLRKKTAETRRIELQNLETEGRLIPRDFVATHLIGAIEAAYRRLLSDTPRKLALMISGAVKSGETVEQIEKRIREDIGTHLQVLKTTAARNLRTKGNVEDHDDLKRAS